jgi:hypothetical protein
MKIDAHLIEFLEKTLERAKAGEVHLFVGVAAITVSADELAREIAAGHEEPPRARVITHTAPGGIIEHLDPISRSALWRTFLAGLTEGVGNLDAQLTLMNAQSGGPLS